jgi:hypothetical protein
MSPQITCSNELAGIRFMMTLRTGLPVGVNFDGLITPNKPLRRLPEESEKTVHHPTML